MLPSFQKRLLIKSIHPTGHKPWLSSFDPMCLTIMSVRLEKMVSSFSWIMELRIKKSREFTGRIIHLMNTRDSMRSIIQKKDVWRGLYFYNERTKKLFPNNSSNLHSCWNNLPLRHVFQTNCLGLVLLLNGFGLQLGLGHLLN